MSLIDLFEASPEDTEQLVLIPGLKLAILIILTHVDVKIIYSLPAIVRDQSKQSVTVVLVLNASFSF